MAVALPPISHWRLGRNTLRPMGMAAGIAATASLLLGAAVTILDAPPLAKAPDAVPTSELGFKSSVLSEESVARVDVILATPLPPRAAAPTLEPWEDYYARPRPVAASGTTVAAVSTDPATELERAVAALPSDAIRPRATGWAAEFITALGYEARRAPGADRIPASVTVAQAILESDWGRSALTRQANNYFGIKAAGISGSAGYVMMATQEVADGETHWVDAPFRAYRSMADSVVDHHRFLHENSRYRTALSLSGDPVVFATALQRAGYATDPRYAAKLIAIMDRYDLYRYDHR